MADIASRPAIAPRMPLRLIAVALVIIALLISAAVLVGSRQTKVPPPFGPAGNGLIPFTQNGDIYLGDPVTGTSSLVVGGPEDDWGASYSPDGTRIAFIRTVDATRFDIYSMRPDGSELRRLTPSPITDQSWVNWASDSRHLALIHPVEATGCPSSGCLNQLDLVDATGRGAVQTIATANGMDFVKFQPPDGRQILYRAVVDDRWGLFTMDADGTNVKRLVETAPGQVDMSFSGATYSADGSQIFYEHGDDTGCCRLWVVNADGTDPHEFRPRGEAWDGVAVPSPDGTWIAYWHVTDDGAISLVRADGTGQVIDLVRDLPGIEHWMWAPDSSRILAFPGDTDVGQAYLLDPAGGPTTTVPWESNGDLDWQRTALEP
jgi:Tol biopolymer transport system component